MKKTTTAYCFVSGHIGFGACVPEGAFGLAEGDDKTVRDIVSVNARLSRVDNETLFVPGVPEAANPRDGITAVAQFIQQLGTRNQSGFRALGA